jgi:hypothetical protein
MTRVWPGCVICGSQSAEEERLEGRAQVVHCPVCGGYAIETRLLDYLRRARAEPRPHVLKLLPGLQRAIRAAAAGHEQAHLTLEHWESDAREYL